jgi:hypothetical protein
MEYITKWWENIQGEVDQGASFIINSFKYGFDRYTQ